MIRVRLLQNNPVLLHIAGLCPLIAVSVTLIKGLAIGLLTMLALILTMCTVSAFRHFTPLRVRLPIILLISTTIVTIIYLLFQAFFYELSVDFGIYIPLIAVNSLLLARLEEYALRQNVTTVLLDSITSGIGIVFIITLTGAFRELLAYGSLFSQADLLFGPALQDRALKFLGGGKGLGLVAMAPGAFIGLGLLIAALNMRRDSGLENGASD